MLQIRKEDYVPAPFHRVSLAQFEELVRLFDFKRRITSFHVHHTWIPRRSDFKGRETIEAMDRFHRTKRGFRDIAQHITLDPDGYIWTGRPWNVAPASAGGHNGTSKAGPFMMEMVGNFDLNQEGFEGTQAAHAYRVVAAILTRAGLGVDAIRFHKEMSDKSCPGSSISKEAFVAAVQAEMDEQAAPRHVDPNEDRETRKAFVEALSGLLEPLSRSDTARDADADAELPEEHETYDDYAARTAAELGLHAEARGEKCPTLSQLMKLVPHVVNLRRGKLSEDDLFVSNRGTVDAIFDRMSAEARNASAESPLKVVFWAHGGLVSQGDALCKAARDLWWWRENGIYPIFFIWQTGLGRAIADILIRSRQGQRGPEEISDWMIEAFVRHWGGERTWDSMKLSAADASGRDGGAAYVANKLKGLVEEHGDRVELHAAGHSAGAIFHSHFIPTAEVRFKSLQLLAPAIRVDEFRTRLDPHLGDQKLVAATKIYTMRDKPERDDHCIQIYRKSLLYLISRGLELKRGEPLLGLERFLTRDAYLAERFGVSPGPNTIGGVAFSPGIGSTATAHGCFDDDIPTMDSVVSMIRGSDPTKSYREAAASRECNRNAIFESSDKPPREVQILSAQPATGGGSGGGTFPGAVAAAVEPPLLRANGRRRALCVGINDYPTAALSGCVNDAENWDRTLRSLGFGTKLLTNGQATREGILTALTELLESSAPGDVAVFQFAGHGTHVHDLDGDELSGRDQALCPIDYADGHLLIDDDIADLFKRIPAGVAVTCFLDNCHSGTGTRFAIGRPDVRAAAGDRPRFVVADAQLEQRHAAFRRGIGIVQRTAAARGPASMREVVFTACEPHELAWESNSEGDFTRNALALLRASAGRLTNRDFHDQLTRTFTPRDRQHPTLDCAPDAEPAPLFGYGAAAAGSNAPGVAERELDPRGVAAQLRRLADDLERS